MFGAKRGEQIFPGQFFPLKLHGVNIIEVNRKRTARENASAAGIASKIVLKRCVDIEYLNGYWSVNINPK